LNKYLAHFDFLGREIEEDFEVVDDLGEELRVKHIVKESFVRTVLEGKVVKIQGPDVEAVLAS
jgi:hypothetical protein